MNTLILSRYCQTRRRNPYTIRIKELNDHPTLSFIIFMALFNRKQSGGKKAPHVCEWHCLVDLMLLLHCPHRSPCIQLNVMGTVNEKSACIVFCPLWFNWLGQVPLMQVWKNTFFKMHGFFFFIEKLIWVEYLWAIAGGSRKCEETQPGHVTVHVASGWLILWASTGADGGEIAASGRRFHSFVA